MLQPPTMTSVLTSMLIISTSLILLAGQPLSPQKVREDSKYPNELSGFRFYQTAKWKDLVPLVSSMADVRRVMGAPTEAHDVAQYTSPYPGDAAAKHPVFTYDYNKDWQILVYFVKYCFDGRATLPQTLADRLCSIDLIPKKRTPLDVAAFTAAFRKKHVGAIDAAWDEYRDESGLVYEVYTTRTRYGHNQPGDLNRIKYAASDEQVDKYATK